MIFFDVSSFSGPRLAWSLIATRLSVLLRELECNHLSADVETSGFGQVRAGRVGCTHKLHKGKPLDRSVVWAVLVEIFRNVDIANGTVLRKHVL